jgi:hypothetical protein
MEISVAYGLHELARLRTLSLSQRPYWDRVWITQQILLRLNIVVCYRFQRMKWKELLTCATAVPFHCSIGRSVRGIVSLKQLCARESRSFDLHYLLTFTSQQKGSNPRNKVYAPLGLSHRENEYGDMFEPDYSKSLRKVYDAVLHHYFDSKETQNDKFLEEFLNVLARFLQLKIHPPDSIIIAYHHKERKRAKNGTG